MAKIVTVAAYKGGVGKTTLALELAYLLDAPLVDLDWDKGGATNRWGYRPGATSPLLDALETGKVPRPRKGRGKPDLVPSDRDFEANQPEANTMAEALEKWAAAWDRAYVVVDTHPGGWALTPNLGHGWLLRRGWQRTDVEALVVGRGLVAAP